MLMSRPTLNSSEPSRQNSHPLHCYALPTDSIPSVCFRFSTCSVLADLNQAYYDRVLVMDQGRVAEFDTVLNLFDREDSIFRSLCDEANLQRADILRIRSEHKVIASP